MPTPPQPSAPVPQPPPPAPDRVVRRELPHTEAVRAGRAWWDSEAEAYYAEHGDFLGDAELVWGPEGWTEAQLGLLGPLSGRRVLEVGSGAAQGGRWCAGQGALVLSSDVSGGMLRVGRRIDGGMRPRTVPSYVQCDGGRLPFADGTFDVVFSAHGAMAFIPDADGAVREWARVLRPGGTLAFSVTHPVRWAFPDVPGVEGLTARSSYFDRLAYVEETSAGRATYSEHHRTVGDLVRAVAGAGLVLVDLVEPEWPADADHVWGGWSRTRGEVLPGTAIFVARRPA
ncbi:class I SAM-dependent methyltransferase [Ornithinimicrobium panacihumi]|uniref:class I SAM-dependent methyltransferase n=1 Tax=Ornithinimicrobium panacihumi TaxID=2008449 RepID=UPI003F89C52E